MNPGKYSENPPRILSWQLAHISQILMDNKIINIKYCENTSNHELIQQKSGILSVLIRDFFFIKKEK